LWTSNLWFRQESLDREEFIWSDVELVTFLERISLNTFTWLDGEENFIQWAENLINLTNLGLVLEIYWSIEVWDFGVDRTTEDIAFNRMHEGAHLKH
jgi:hypothetical protein